MLSLSRVNISNMCLNMNIFWKLLGPLHWNPAFKCAWGIGMRTVKLSEGGFRVWYGRDLNV